MHHPPDILLFVGRFHVLLVHLPIGMLLLLALLEIAAFFPRFKNANSAAGLILAVLAPISVVTAVCGKLLSLGGGYAENLLVWHERLGIATAAGCVLAAFLFWIGKTGIYRAVLLVTVVVMSVAGHLGGSLTHGSDYLFRYAPKPVQKLLGLAAHSAPAAPATEIAAQTNPQSLPVFTDAIVPVFQAKCESCHGPEKSKGGLRLDSFAAVQAGGEDGPILNPADPAQSELLRRILLPTDDDDHMPPDGKAQLTAAEIALLKWWVAVGAPATNSVEQLQTPPEVLRAIAVQSGAK